MDIHQKLVKNSFVKSTIHHAFFALMLSISGVFVIVFGVHGLINGEPITVFLVSLIIVLLFAGMIYMVLRMYLRDYKYLCAYRINNSGAYALKSIDGKVVYISRRKLFSGVEVLVIAQNNSNKSVVTVHIPNFQRKLISLGKHCLAYYLPHTHIGCIATDSEVYHA